MNKPRTVWPPLFRGLRPLVSQWRDFWRTPDPLLLHEGGSGELAVAWLRLLVIAFALVMPFVEFLRTPGSDLARTGFLSGAVAIVFAVGILVLTKRRFYRPWFGFVTSILDVTFVSAALVALLASGRPDIVVNSRVIYPVYFIAIGAMALRYDARICVLAGLFGVFQYATIVAFVDLRWALDAPPFSTSEYGQFNIGAHYARLAILLCSVILSTDVALRKQRLRWLAARDPLTGLINRGFFDERMQAEVSRTNRTGRLLSVAMIDIDHFKRFNDDFGHIVGDEVLKVLAGIFKQSLRKSDLIARYGGEEFIVLFPETPAEFAVLTADRLRVSVEQSTVTVSIGISELPTDGKDMRTVIDMADMRLYEAKHAGRNRVIGPHDVEAPAGAVAAGPTDEAP
jgi:diguanylate cyclase (GGDEF)-like protein